MKKRFSRTDRRRRVRGGGRGVVGCACHRVDHPSSGVSSPGIERLVNTLTFTLKNMTMHSNALNHRNINRRNLCKHHKKKCVMSGLQPPTVEESTSPPLWQPELTGTGCFVCLLSAVAYVVMSTKKKVNAVVKKSSAPKRAKKVRSISVSLDLECPGRIEVPVPTANPQQAKMLVSKHLPASLPRSVVGDRYRTVSACEFVEQYLANMSSESQAQIMSSIGEEEKASITRLLKEDKFPFQKLPEDCKLKVFEFLSPNERGVASQVCAEWSALMKDSSLWNTLDFTTFQLCHVRTRSHECTELCYALYRNRVKKYIQYLKTVRPAVRDLRFAFDIADYRDGWHDALQQLFRTARLIDLETAHLNWKETQVKPYLSESMTWSTNDYNDLMYRHKHRQRLFVNFFDKFTAAAPNIKKLILPFDWSARSLQALSRLKRLESLVLEKYFVFQPLEQASIDQLFWNVPSLRRLIIEAWTPSGRGIILYTMNSKKLEYLDISQCRGVYLREVDLPECEMFKVSRHPWNGPLVSHDSMNIPCIYDVLRHGMPKLKQLNEHILHTNWKEVVYEELETVLRAVCSCKAHKTSWAM